MSEKKAVKFDSDDFEKDQVENPDAFGLSEKELWQRIEPILDELLDELKANGKIEISYTTSEVEHLNSILNNLNMISKNHNLLVHIADSIDKARRFVKVVSEFGFDDSSSSHLFVEVSALLLIQNFEFFKTALLFHLRNVDYRASRFDETMQSSAPNVWRKLKPILDNKFRNSLAHGTWAIENQKVVLFEDAKLVPFEKLALSDFMIRVKTQNVLYACLMNLIHKKRKDNFFS